MNIDMERKVAWLVALEGIRSTIARYARAGDDRNDPAQMKLLLAQDAVWEAEGFGRFEGREVIAEALAKVAQERILWSLHFPVAPIVDLSDDLDRAHAYWWLWELMTHKGDDGVPRNCWFAATYDCDFVRKPDGWKIHHLVLKPGKMVEYIEPPGA